MSFLGIPFFFNFYRTENRCLHCISDFLPMDKTTNVTMEDDDVVPLPPANKDEKPLRADALREAIAMAAAHSKLRSKDEATKVLVEHDSPAGDGSKPSL